MDHTGMPRGAYQDRLSLTRAGAIGISHEVGHDSSIDQVSETKAPKQMILQYEQLDEDLERASTNSH